jgi:hypothetical protein
MRVSTTIMSVRRDGGHFDRNCYGLARSTLNCAPPLLHDLSTRTRFLASISIAPGSVAMECLCSADC